MHTMPNTPTLLRTSQPTEFELMIERIVAHARTLSLAELADAIERSPSTAARRRRGHGWTTAEVALLADALSIRPSQVISA